MGGDVRARLGEGEREALIEIITSAPMHKKAAFVIDEVEAILAARAAAPDGLRAAVEGLRLDEELAELQSFVWVETRHEPTRLSVAVLRDRLKAVLAAHPAPGTRDTIEEDA